MAFVLMGLGFGALVAFGVVGTERICSLGIREFQGCSVLGYGVRSYRQCSGLGGCRGWPGFRGVGV